MLCHSASAPGPLAAAAPRCAPAGCALPPCCFLAAAARAPALPRLQLQLETHEDAAQLIKHPMLGRILRSGKRAAAARQQVGSTTAACGRSQRVQEREQRRPAAAAARAQRCSMCVRRLTRRLRCFLGPRAILPAGARGQGRGQAAEGAAMLSKDGPSGPVCALQRWPMALPGAPAGPGPCQGPPPPLAPIKGPPPSAGGPQVRSWPWLLLLDAPGPPPGLPRASERMARMLALLPAYLLSTVQGDRSSPAERPMGAAAGPLGRPGQSAAPMPGAMEAALAPRRPHVMPYGAASRLSYGCTYLQAASGVLPLHPPAAASAPPCTTARQPAAPSCRPAAVNKHPALKHQHTNRTSSLHAPKQRCGMPKAVAAPWPSYDGGGLGH